MSVSTILDELMGPQGEIARSVQIFVPELVLCGTILLLLLSRLFGIDRRIPGCWVALIGSLATFVCVFAQFMYVLQGPEAGGNALSGLYGSLGFTAEGVGLTGESFFAGMVTHDLFSIFFRLGLSLFLVLVIALTVLSGIPDNEDSPDFYALMCGATVGMLVAVSANHLLMIFLSIEMMSVPSYALVGFLKGRKTSSEAAFKYVVYGAGTAGVMLYGISLLAGLLGTGDLGQLAERFVLLMEGETFSVQNATAVTVVLGVMMVLVGFAFKLSLVPFHFWCPDAFEGAAAEVGGFLSVASKAAAFALLVRFMLAFTGPEPVLQDFSLFYGLALGVLAAASMTLGNLAAFTQNNIKRMLAYSTIAHAGYMVMAVAALLVISTVQDGTPEAGRFDNYTATLGGESVAMLSARCLEGLMYYLAVYLFMNLAAFAVVALIRNETYREDIDAYKGLISSNTATQVLCVCLAISFFSLVGLPPFGGFFAKMMIFLSVFSAGYVHWLMWVILGVAAANTVVSLFYYVRVLRAIFISPREAEVRPVQLPGLVGVYVAIITVPIVALGMSHLQHHLSEKALHVAETLFRG